MHEIEPFAIVEFENSQDAYQVKISMLLEELKDFELVNSSEVAIVSLDSLETLNKVCAEAEISKEIKVNYSHLPFPSYDREDKTAYSVLIECESASHHNMIHSMWLDCDRDEDNILDDIDWFLSWSPVRGLEACEEWAITDSEGFEDIDLDDFKNAEDLALLAEAFQDKDAGALAAYIKETSYDRASGVIDDFEDYYWGTYRSETDFAEEWAIECGHLDEMTDRNPLRDCIDWSEVAEYLENNGYWFIWDGYETVYVFTH